jgi:hypothetical protein
MTTQHWWRLQSGRRGGAGAWCACMCTRLLRTGTSWVTAAGADWNQTYKARLQLSKLLLQGVQEQATKSLLPCCQQCSYLCLCKVEWGGGTGGGGRVLVPALILRLHVAACLAACLAAC